MNIQINNHHILVDGVKVNQWRYFDNCRQIYKYDDKIIKVDNRKDSDYQDDAADNQCESEVQFLNRVRPEDKKYFVPIIEFGEKYVVQPLIKFRRGTKSRKKYLEVKSIAFKYGLWDVDYSHNWGITQDGQPVIYDYAL